MGIVESKKYLFEVFKVIKDELLNKKQEDKNNKLQVTNTISTHTKLSFINLSISYFLYLFLSSILWTILVKVKYSWDKVIKLKF